MQLLHQCIGLKQIAQQQHEAVIAVCLYITSNAGPSFHSAANAGPNP
ncbi:hypothetical protein AF72_00330 [Xylella taiwanensis]|uniref:Uncharacterized protein n=1 Tax=Xylella taiwanensis TaxID=1444770 RepID=Z9JNQ0_9GAMM|nr:hypothetical protein AF72_00330 [Xylella taiwanensis]